MDKEDYGFEYVIDASDKELFARPFHKDDMAAVVEYAKSITINPDNYRTYLGIGCAPTFRKTGALLETSEEELREIAGRPDQYFSLGLWSGDQELLAFVTLQLEDVDQFLTDRQNVAFNSEFENKWDEWLEYKNHRIMAFRGDLAIRGRTAYSGLRDILYYLALKELRKRGIRYCVTEVFHIVDCMDRDGMHGVNVFNNPSFVSQIEGGGAVYVGDYKIMTKQIGEGISIRYYAKLLEYRVEHLYQICGEMLERKSIRVIQTG